MNKEKIYNYMACTGEILIIIGAMLWITGTVAANYLFATGATLFALGRINEKKVQGSITLSRLYGQRALGLIAILLSAVAMNLNGGFYFGMYLRPSMWLIPFVVFVVIELYTAFRLPQQIKKEQK